MSPPAELNLAILSDPGCDASTLAAEADEVEKPSLRLIPKPANQPSEVTQLFQTMNAEHRKLATSIRTAIAEKYELWTKIDLRKVNNLEERKEIKFLRQAQKEETAAALAKLKQAKSTSLQSYIERSTGLTVDLSGYRAAKERWREAQTRPASKPDLHLVQPPKLQPEVLPAERNIFRRGIAAAAVAALATGSFLAAGQTPIKQSPVNTRNAAQYTKAHQPQISALPELARIKTDLPEQMKTPEPDPELDKLLALPGVDPIDTAEANKVMETFPFAMSELERVVAQDGYGILTDGSGILSSGIQTNYFLYNGRIIAKTTTSTGFGGWGDDSGSHATPEGLLKVIGSVVAEPGRVIKGGVITDQFIQNSTNKKDPITGARLTLSGEYATNQETQKRYILAHGTPNITGLGQAVSNGCLRLRDEVAIFLGTAKSDVYFYVASQPATPSMIAKMKGVDIYAEARTRLKTRTKISQASLPRQQKRERG